MGYAQWIEVKIVSENTTLEIKSASLDWGKFYEYGDKNKEISTENINKITIDSGKIARICACGRDGAAAGTEGKFELYDGKTKIGEFKWDCPYNKKSNTFSWSQAEKTPSYRTDREGGNTDSGAIGNVTLTCIKI